MKKVVSISVILTDGITERSAAETLLKAAKRI